MSVGKTRVLVIDDNADLRELIRDSLEHEGFEVAAVADGGLGLAAHRSKPAHILITDIFMPEREGMETLAVLREEFPAVKIIVMSGGGAKQAVDYLGVALQLGAVKSFSKPFDLRALAAAVRELAHAPASPTPPLPKPVLHRPRRPL